MNTSFDAVALARDKDHGVLSWVGFFCWQAHHLITAGLIEVFSESYFKTKK